MIETEIKLRWPERRGDPHACLRAAGCTVHAPRVLEIDQLFDRASGELRQSDQILRLRRSGDRSTVTYKGPASRERYKSREEIEFDVNGAENLEIVLARLGYLPGFRYEKYRTAFRIPGEDGLITIDETPIGMFLELEGPKDWIDAASKRLGFASGDYLTASYASLYREHRARHPDAPRDMIFVHKSVTLLSQKSP